MTMKLNETNKPIKEIAIPYVMIAYSSWTKCVGCGDNANVSFEAADERYSVRMGGTSFFFCFSHSGLPHYVLFSHWIYVDMSISTQS